MSKPGQSLLGPVEITVLVARSQDLAIQCQGLGLDGAGRVSSAEQIVSLSPVTAIELLRRRKKRVGKRSTGCEASIISNLPLASISSLFLSCSLAKHEKNIISANLLVA